ncbi:unnamed protein product [Tilletia controversa]|uniref:Major facilitator superfamily (MFS) profile domain-containing protein n=3 Tax=Tilletia TaxID=13289 RepID=A0A8X7STM7_9BASI|nr:hypothetical protein CF336_g7585 [Tilletia laevis]KAE8186910.1 hypothetical protein CF328_g7083 [Tilletia controversa]KAE8248075.1 hypothetical protein A4X03_0g6880 [Tilletia caries]KAE8188203.1 hypothetical protein CF335_g6956 [Tilletia laevis]KAE8240035.1 hypothetical protein A4X06_0g7935 [Tilletia controversa]
MSAVLPVIPIPLEPVHSRQSPTALTEPGQLGAPYLPDPTAINTGTTGYFHFDINERPISSASGGQVTPAAGPESGPVSRSQSMNRLLSEAGVGTAGEILASNLPPTDQGKGAYLFLLAAMLTEFSFFGVPFSFGTYLSYHQNNVSSPFHNVSASSISATGAALTALDYVMPWLLCSLFLLKPHFIRPALLTAVILNFVSVMAASVVPANSGVGLFILQGMLPGISGGIAFTPVIMWLPEWFDARRGMATGVAYLGGSVGGILFPLAFNQSLQTVGFRWTLRVQAMIQLVVGVAILASLRPRIPIRAPTQDDRDRRGGLRAYLPGTPRALLSPIGLCVALGHIFQTSAWTAVSLFISTLCTDIGLSESVSSGVLAAFNASGLFGLLFAGILADMIPFETLMILSAGGCAVFAYLLLGFANSLGVVMAFVLLFGVTGAGFSTAVTPASRALCATTNSPADFSLIALNLVLARGIGVTIGPLIASALYRPDRASDHALWGGHGLRDLVLSSGARWSASSAYRHPRSGFVRSAELRGMYGIPLQDLSVTHPDVDGQLLIGDLDAVNVANLGGSRSDC